MMSKRMTFLIGFLCACVLGGCRATTEVDVIRGLLPLIAYNGSSLPMVVSPLPSVGLDGSVSHCNEVVASGELDLRDDGQYLVYVSYQNSCTGAGLSAASDSGRFAQVGDSLSLTVAGVPSRDVIWGKTFSDHVTVYFYGTTLDFRR